MLFLSGPPNLGRGATVKLVESAEDAPGGGPFRGEEVEEGLAHSPGRSTSVATTSSVHRSAKSFTVRPTVYSMQQEHGWDFWMGEWGKGRREMGRGGGCPPHPDGRHHWIGASQRQESHDTTFAHLCIRCVSGAVVRGGGEGRGRDMAAGALHCFGA